MNVKLRLIEFESTIADILSLSAVHVASRIANILLLLLLFGAKSAQLQKPAIRSKQSPGKCRKIHTVDSVVEPVCHTKNVAKGHREGFAMAAFITFFAALLLLL